MPDKMVGSFFSREKSDVYQALNRIKEDLRFCIFMYACIDK